MQNEDEEQRGLEKKLGRLRPRDLDESLINELVTSLKPENKEVINRQGGEMYSPNVLWVRFAPVAAAAGVVLLGTFFLRYESRIDALQAQRNGASLESDGNAVVSRENPAASMAASTLPSSTQQVSFPVPRLGVGQQYGATDFSPEASGLMPVSAQNYLQTGSEVFNDLNRNALPITSLHFEDAYDWQGLGADESSVIQEEEVKRDDQ